MGRSRLPELWLQQELGSLHQLSEQPWGEEYYHVAKAETEASDVRERRAPRLGINSVDP